MPHDVQLARLTRFGSRRQQSTRRGRPPRRDRRDELLRAARTLFLAAGYEGTSMDSSPRWLGCQRPRLTHISEARRSFIARPCSPMRPAPSSRRSRRMAPSRKRLQASVGDFCGRFYHRRTSRACGLWRSTGTDFETSVPASWRKPTGSRFASSSATWSPPIRPVGSIRQIPNLQRSTSSVCFWGSRKCRCC